MIRLLFLALPILAFGRPAEYALDEMRVEVSDLKHSLHTLQVELQLLDDKFRSQKPVDTLPIKDLERRLSLIEKTQDKIVADLRQIAQKASDLEQSLLSQSEKLGEVSKLKSTLTSISQAMKPQKSTYRVQSGDSLEKIARHNRTTVETIKRLNHLKSDKITVGQELQLTDGS